MTTTSIFTVSSTTALKPQFTVEKQVNSSGVEPKIRLSSSQPLSLKTSKLESSSSKSKKPSLFPFHSEEALHSKSNGKNTISKESEKKETKISRVSGKKILGFPDSNKVYIFEIINTNIQESVAIESFGKDLEAASENLNSRYIAADDLL